MRYKISGMVGVVLGFLLLVVEYRTFSATGDFGSLLLPSITFLGLGVYYLVKKAPDTSPPDVSAEDRVKKLRGE